jgi:translocation and assembly module TamA
MNYKIFIWILILSSLYSENNSAKVVHKYHNITIIGNTNIKESTLQEAIGVERNGILEFYKEENPKIKDKLLPSLPEALRGFYNSEGFYDANFTIKITKELVTIDIDEHRAVVVTDINISSDYNISKFITQKKGDRFRTKDFINTKNSIIQALLKDGHCSYDLDTKAFVDLDRARVDLRFILTKGGYCTFGKVTTKGLDRVSDGVVVSRVRAREGKRFNLELIQDSYKALYGLDTFDMVNIRYDRKFYNVVPIDIRLKEITKKNYFMGGLSYDTNVGAGIRTEYIRKNFFGDARKLRVRTSYSTLEQLLEFAHYLPALFNISEYYIDLFNKIGYSNLEYEGFMERRGYLEAHLSYTNEKLHIRAGLAMENIDISLKDNVNRDKVIKAINDGSFLLIYPFASFIYDRRDSKLNPKSGYYIAGEVEYGIDYDSDASSYLKYTLEGRLIETFNSLTLSSVLKVGIVDELTNELPESKLFFGGGAYSNRAYGYNRVGVIYSPTRYGLDGAYSMVNLSLEANYPIVGDLYGAIFNDNTMLTINSYDFSGDILSSAGFGVRYVTPIGPIKIDVGMNIYDPSQYGIGFQIGQSF